MKKSRVAIIKIQNNNYSNAIQEIFAKLGGVEKIVPQNGNVILKPNWVTNKHYSTGAVTNTEVLSAICSEILEKTNVTITIAESSCVGEDTKKVIQTNNVEKLSSTRLKIVDLKEENYIPTIVPNALKYRRLSFPEVILKSDMVINIPVMKTHDALPATLGLKNMKGVLRDDDKRKFHLWGLEEGIIDLNQVVLPDLTIVDASVGMEGNGPANGTPVNLNLLIASQDPLAAEVVSLKIMGLDVNKLNYIDMAYKAGFGEKDINKIEVLGEKIDDVYYKFKTSFYDQEKQIDSYLKIYDRNACTGCKNIIVQFLQRRPNITNKYVSINCGIYEAKATINSDCSIGLGDCLYKQKNQFNKYIEGCPPSVEKLLEAYLDADCNKD